MSDFFDGNNLHLAPMANSASDSPVPIPPTPEGVGVEIALKAIEQVASFLLECTKASEIEATKREYIRQQANIHIRAIEADVQKFQLALAASTAVRMNLASALAALVTRENIDESILKLATVYAGLLANSDPLKSYSE